MGDLILGIILLIALLDGWRRGIIKILGSYGGIIVGVFLARRLTPLLLPMLLPQLEKHLGQTTGISPDSVLLAEWFFTDSALGRLLELVIFIVLTSAITWLVRFATGAFGSVINFTPLYLIYVWILPWLISLLPDLAVVNTIFTSSKLVLQFILEIGSLIWYSALSIM